MRTEFSLHEYDSQGQLKLPGLFWLVMLLQARSWLVLIMAGASRQQGDQLLALIYPDRHAFKLGLLMGVVALLAMLLTGYRQKFPRLWSAWRWVVLATTVASLAWQIGQFDLSALEQSPLPILIILFDLFALIWWLFDPRLKACFRREIPLHD